MFRQSVFTIAAIYLLIQIIGLYAGNVYIQGIKEGEFEPAIENPESIESSFNFFAYILIATVAILLAVRFWKPSLRGFEAFAVFFSSWIAFDLLIPLNIWYLSLGFFLALFLTAWKMLRPTILSQNVAAIFSGAGVAALLGGSFGIIPSLVFLLILCVYDFVSVFVTKHMISLAKVITEKPTAFTIASPHKFERAKFIPVKGRKKRIHVFQLGLGDVVIPLMFSISLLSKYSMINSILSAAGSLIALTLMLYYMTKKPQVLPALPFISMGTLGGFLISLLL